MYDEGWWFQAVEGFWLQAWWLWPRGGVMGWQAWELRGGEGLLIGIKAEAKGEGVADRYDGWGWGWGWEGVYENEIIHIETLFITTAPK